MHHLTKALRTGATAILVCGLSCLNTNAAKADPTPDVNTLAAAMSKGYNLNNCAAQAPPNGALAMIQCGQNSDSNGPAFGQYLLFGSSSDLASSFTASIAGDTLANCGDVKSPNVWHRGSTSEAAGQVACGTYQGTAEITWTTDNKNVESVIRGANGDIKPLYDWWRTNG